MKTKKTLVIMLLTLTLLIPTKSFAINWFWESWWDSDENAVSNEQYAEDVDDEDSSWWNWWNWWDSDEDDVSNEQYAEEESDVTNASDEQYAEDVDEEDPIDKHARELAESYGWTYDAEHMAFCYGNIIF